jgi:DDE superfamily endonuclease
MASLLAILIHEASSMRIRMEFAGGDEIARSISSRVEFCTRGCVAALSCEPVAACRLGLLVQPRRDEAAALKLLRNLMKKQGAAPAVLVTDKLRSYAAACRHPGLSGRHEQGLH